MRQDGRLWSLECGVWAGSCVGSLGRDLGLNGRLWSLECGLWVGSCLWASGCRGRVLLTPLLVSFLVLLLIAS